MNKVLLDLGIIQINWYSFFIFFAMLIAALLIKYEAKKKGLAEETLIDMIFYGIIFGILGARIYYVIFNLDYYLTNPKEIFMIWHGGLAIHGGIIGGLLTIFYYCHKHNVSSIKILDIVVVGLIIAQAIGRWGNFFNGEAHGPIVSHLDYLPSFIKEGMYINGNYYMPTFLYESLWCLLGFIVLLIIRKYVKKPGFLTSVYLMWYGMGRFFIESLRTDSLMLLNLKAAQLVSIIMVLIGLIMFILILTKNIFKEEKK